MSKIDQVDYKYYLIVMMDGEHFIHSGWEFASDAKDARDDSFIMGSVYTRKYCCQLGIDPKEDKNWMST